MLAPTTRIEMMLNHDLAVPAAPLQSGSKCLRFFDAQLVDEHSRAVIGFLNRRHNRSNRRSFLLTRHSENGSER